MALKEAHSEQALANPMISTVLAGKGEAGSWSLRWVTISCPKNCCCTLSDHFRRQSSGSAPAPRAFFCLDSTGTRACPLTPLPMPGCAVASSLQQDFLCTMKMLGRCKWIWPNLGSAKHINYEEDIRIHTKHPSLVRPSLISVVGYQLGSLRTRPPHSRLSDKNRRFSSFSTQLQSSFYTHTPLPLSSKISFPHIAVANL